MLLLEAIHNCLCINIFTHAAFHALSVMRYVGINIFFHCSNELLFLATEIVSSNYILFLLTWFVVFMSVQTLIHLCIASLSHYMVIFSLFFGEGVLTFNFCATFLTNCGRS